MSLSRHVSAAHDSCTETNRTANLPSDSPPSTLLPWLHELQLPVQALIYIAQYSVQVFFGEQSVLCQFEHSFVIVLSKSDREKKKNQWKMNGTLGSKLWTDFVLNPIQFLFVGAVYCLFVSTKTLLACAITYFYRRTCALENTFMALIS